jgi:hypothetical protein
MTTPPDIKGYTPKLIYQKLKSEDLFERGIELDPAHVTDMYVQNLLIRALARIVGQGPTGPVVVKCTPDGSLSTVVRGGAFDAYERHDNLFEISGAERTADGTLAGYLVDSSEDFVAEGIKEGDTVFNTTDGTQTYVVSVAATQLELEDDIFISGEKYKIYPCVNITFSQQMTRADLFTYVGKVDYQLVRDDVQPLGAKIPLFEDSFYSLDFNTLKVRATPTDIPTTGTTRTTVFGWYRLEG